MNNKPIYMDYMATTPVDDRVIEVMNRYLGWNGIFGNASSETHLYGMNAAKAVSDARDNIAAAINAVSDEIYFTSGATEADNLAIIGAALFYQKQGKHIITLSTEHKAVLDSMHHLENIGFRVTYLQPKKDGLLNFDDLKNAITSETILVSVMHVNNEIGVIQDIQTIGAFLKEKGILFHVDAAQSLGKIPIDVRAMSVDLMSFSSHKIYGPKGSGALFVSQKPRVRLEPLTFGGGQERGLRSGTLATHQIMGFAEAVRIASISMKEEQTRMLHFRETLWNGIKNLPNIQLNGHPTERIAGNLNITFKGLDGASLRYALHELAISSTSACASASFQPSYVLKALGVSERDALSSIRFSVGRFTEPADITRAIEVICEQVQRLIALAPA